MDFCVCLFPPVSVEVVIFSSVSPSFLPSLLLLHFLSSAFAPLLAADVLALARPMA